MGKKAVIGVDFGGSASKATLLSEDGAIIATASVEYPSHYPVPGWLEQDPEDYIDAFIANVKTLFEKTGIKKEDIVALSLDAATHMAVLAGEDEAPLRPIIHWSDRRSTRQAEELIERHGDLIRARCVNAPSSAWTLPQLLWLRENTPEVLEKVKRVYFAKDYVRSRITGDFCTDHIEAMGALLADDHSEIWDPDLCKLAGIYVDALPEIRRPVDIAGYVSKQYAALTGLLEGMPVLVGSTDTALEVYASGAVTVGDATVKLATAGRICPVTTGPIESRQFFNYKHIVPGLWYPGTGTRTCAASYGWYRSLFGGEEEIHAAEAGKNTYELLNEGAEGVPPGSDGLLFHPYLQGEMTPYFNDHLRGSFTGASIFHTKGHFTRAVLEGVAYSLRDCLQEISRHQIAMGRCHIIGGGAKSPLWRQIVTDTLNLPMQYTKMVDSSLGSAMLAGVSAGFFRDYEESVHCCAAAEDALVPSLTLTGVYDKGFKKYKAVQAALEKVYAEFDE